DNGISFTRTPSGVVEGGHEIAAGSSREADAVVGADVPEAIAEFEAEVGGDVPGGGEVALEAEAAVGAVEEAGVLEQIGAEVMDVVVFELGVGNEIEAALERPLLVDLPERAQAEAKTLPGEPAGDDVAGREGAVAGEEIGAALGHVFFGPILPAEQEIDGEEGVGIAEAVPGDDAPSEIEVEVVEVVGVGVVEGVGSDVGVAAAVEILIAQTAGARGADAEIGADDGATATERV